MAVGIDILKISRLESLIKDDKFLNKVFSQKELEYFNTRNFNISTVAGNFCAKEAFSKAIGLGIRGFSLNEISVLRDFFGKPYYEFSDNINNILNSINITKVEVTISHEKDYAIAYAYARNEKNYDEFLAASLKSKCDDEGIINYNLAESIVPKRKSDAHKGDFGRVTAIAGSIGLTGAARLCCEAALKCGSGLITLITPKSLNSIFEVCLKEIMTYPSEDNNGILSKKGIDAILDKCHKSDVIIFGCGLSNNDDIQFILQNIIENCNTPMVIDADGINALSENINILTNHRQSIVLTPHIAEFARLIGKEVDYVIKNSDKLGAEFAKKYNICLVLKSHNTKVYMPNGKMYKNILGNSGMATGGSGDVLAGVIASFIGQKLDFSLSAILGVYIHSLAADMAALKLGEYSLTPTDIINMLAYALKFLGG